MRIYVGNLSYKLRNDDLKKAFELYGEVASARIITDKVTRKSKGYGFVEMPNEEEANKAIASLNETELESRVIKVSEAKNSQHNQTENTEN